MSTSSLAIIIPTRNNSSDIEAHLSMVSHCFDLATEIIVVDSSTDNTPEVCQAMLPGHARIIKHPPGLYASWNTAIQEVRSDYIYISTVGDIIERGFLQKLLKICETNSLDMAISPPEFVGAKSGYHWPIHKFIKKYKISDSVVIEPNDLVMLNYLSLSKYGLSSLSGSFASNMVRAKFLQEHPFPTNYGGFGDTMWFAQNCGFLRLGLFPEVGSTFLIHASNHSKFTDRELHDCWQLAINYQTRRLADYGIIFLRTKTDGYYSCKRDLKHLRREYPGFFNFTFSKIYKSVYKKYLKLSLDLEVRRIEKIVDNFFN